MELSEKESIKYSKISMIATHDIYTHPPWVMHGRHALLLSLMQILYLYLIYCLSYSKHSFKFTYIIVRLFCYVYHLRPQDPFPPNKGIPMHHSWKYTIFRPRISAFGLPKIYYIICSSADWYTHSTLWMYNQQSFNSLEEERWGSLWDITINEMETYRWIMPHSQIR